MSRAWRAAGLLAVLLAWTAPAHAQELVVDLSEPVVAISTGFAGSHLLLFGAIQGEGDVIVVVRGPIGDTAVRRKERVAGIWVDRAQMAFTNVPEFYSLAATRPVAEILPEDQRINYQLGLRYLELVPRIPGAAPEDTRVFREALLRNKVATELYQDQVGRVVFVGNRLFRTTLHFPSNVPVGTFVIDVYLVRNKNVVSVKTSLLEVQKIGIEAGIYDLAQRHAPAYGLIAITLAAVAGWLAGAAFRKS